jgi:hypothetical protein
MQIGQNLDTHADGDKISTKSSGPNKTEVTLNTNGFFAFGGAAGNKGLNLNLVR